MSSSVGNIQPSNNKMAVKFINWFTSKYASDKNQQYLIGKCKNEKDEVFCIAFKLYSYKFSWTEDANGIPYFADADSEMESKAYHMFKHGQLNLGNVELLQDRSKLFYTLNEILDAPEDIDTKYRNVSVVAFSGTDTQKSNEKDKLYIERDPVKWFFILYDINPSGYYHIDAKYLKPLASVISAPEIFVDIPIQDAYKLKDIMTPVDTLDITNNLISFDIESWHPGTFPDAKIHPISHIGIDVYNKFVPENQIALSLITEELINTDPVFSATNSIGIPSKGRLPTDAELKANNCIRVGNDIVDKILYSSNGIIKYFKQFEKPGNRVINVVLSERNILRITAKFFANPNSDIILSFNGNNFDYDYIKTRANKHNVNMQDPIKLDVVTQDQLYKGYKGKDILRNSPNIFLDLYVYYKVEYPAKYASYKLKDIASSAFWCMHLCNFQDDANDQVHFIRSGESEHFDHILDTSNYVLINTRAHKIIKKSKTDLVISSLNEEGDPIEYIPGNEYKVQLTKDAVEIFDRKAYSDYTIEKAVDIGLYCLHDAALCRYLFEYEKFDTKLEARCGTWLMPQRQCFCKGSSVTISGAYLQKQIKSKMVVIQPELNIDDEDFQGGFVITPKINVCEEPVFIFDFLSLYPTIFITYNISPETIVCTFTYSTYEEYTTLMEVCKNRYPYPKYALIPIPKENTSLLMVYKRDKIGFVPSILKDGMNDRAAYKKQMKAAKTPHLKNFYDSQQYEAKIRINSQYGIYSSDIAAFGSKIGAQSCTAGSRAALKYMLACIDGTQIINGVWKTNDKVFNPFTREIMSGAEIQVYDPKDSVEWNWTFPEQKDVITIMNAYGDTDSAMFMFKNTGLLTDSITAEIGKKLETFINDNLLAGSGVFELEKILRKMCFPKKKKYFGKTLSGGLYTKGISLVRKDVCELHKDVIKQTIEMIFSKCTDEDISKYATGVYLNEKHLAETGQTDLAKYVLTTTYRSDYKSEKNASNAAKRFNATHEEQIAVGDRFPYIYTVQKGKGAFDSIEALISLDKTPEGILDIDYYFKKKLKNDLCSILPHGYELKVPF